ncbi:MAG: hypothetical protein ACREV6_11125 [Clostridium sp.]|uniref:hypothetical protein n=1 Tax=Clostridium sp. TaxID=1506 RepID=UPI003D6CF4E3
MMSILGILGTVHSDEMRKEYNFSLEKMAEIIKRFKPDIICGEVRPEDWQKYCDTSEYTGYLGPNEYRKLIMPLCEKQGIRFIPVDWFEDDLVNIDYFRGKTDVEINSIEKQFESIMSIYMEVAKKSIIPFNSFEFNDIVEKKQDFQNGINPTVHNLCWIYRNQIMIERIKRVLENNKGKRILCTVGAEHTYFYFNNLNEEGWELIYPLS